MVYIDIILNKVIIKTCRLSDKFTALRLGGANEYMEKFSATVCAEGNLQIMWLGQAGFLFKNSKQKVLAVDIYLSDLAMKKDGNKRLTPAVISKEELKADIVLASHSHTDHLDLDSLPEILKGETKIYCS